MESRALPHGEQRHKTRPAATSPASSARTDSPDRLVDRLPMRGDNRLPQHARTQNEAAVRTESSVRANHELSDRIHIRKREPKFPGRIHGDPADAGKVWAVRYKHARDLIYAELGQGTAAARVGVLSGRSKGDRIIYG